MKKQLVMGTLAAAMTMGAMAPAMADDGLAASAGVASAYLWRGIDLGDGSAAVSGDIHYSMGGAYAGVWGSSGDSGLGNEYDLYAGYALELGGVGIDLSVWNYNYSDGAVRDDTTGEFTDVILGLSLGGATFKYYDAVAGGHGEYYTLSYGMNGVTALVGYHDLAGDVLDSSDAFVGKAEDYTHLDLTYAYNDNLSFTVSKIIDDADIDGVNDGLELGGDDDMIFVVSYSLPIQ